ncbi:hypothetical protein MIT9_P2016 [Methylomarinovum caldicuralii]|uniref:CBS domain-containing protein n=1 Tax=Methylomarinovum caldicuralii TaxID=438856 RepID=A0AAU9CHF8_9GAMM|nr:CBS domain-containing protein [Methylomarinovum caldicuralii]BCX82430.1 hypothetical protein MIT9_P2016 [Methylomarinovum caldicuralii]
MAEPQALAQRKQTRKKKKKSRSYKGKALLWIFLFMVADEITPGLPLAEAFILALLIFLPRWLLEMVHRVYEYMPDRQSWHTVGDICKRDVVTVAPDARALEVAQLMRDEHLRSLIVVETRPYVPEAGEGEETAAKAAGKKGKALAKTAGESIQVPVGIVTDRDLALRVEGQGLLWEDTLAEEIMTPDPVVARADQDVHAVVEKMREIGARQLPIVDERGHLIGTLSLDDTIAMLSHSLEDVVELLQREIQREAEVSR